ncbi:MAG: arylsulfatase [Novipirellula sp. JB048]
MSFLSPRVLRLAVLCLAVLVAMAVGLSTTEAAAKSPNMIFIMADDLGYGELGCYGQTQIKTPRLDQMAAEGLRFTQFYAGSTVCAPSRSVLMTGQHTGHTHVRGNAGPGNRAIQSLRDQDVTVAEMLKASGYTTGLIGKWGLGEVEHEGYVLKQGFDRFFGYLNQTHAHNYYPEFVWNNDEKLPLGNVVQRVEGVDPSRGFVGGTATERVDYSHDLFIAEAMTFIDTHKEKPFFLVLSLTIPHANNEGFRMTGNGAEVPDFGIYESHGWSDQDKGQAAMISRMDGDVGRILDQLRELKIAENTLVFFTSDNGPHNEAGHSLDTFHPAGPLRGIKRSLYEGGIRVPAIAWWPETIAAGGTTDLIAYFGDWMATAAEIAGAQPPANVDSISFLPTLTGDLAEQQQHEYLYWEFYEQGGRQAVCFEEWKAIRQPMKSGPLELYNLSRDLGEQDNLASEHPQVVERAQRYMEQAHTPHPNWTPR